MNKVTQRKGDIAVTQAIATFTRLGYDVSVPVTESAAYDLVVDCEGQLFKVQCKYTSSGEIDLRCIHSNSKGYVVKKYSATSFDWLYAYSLTDGEYLYKQSLEGRTSIRLSRMEKI